MIIRKLIGGLVLAGLCMSAHANIIFQTEDATKRGNLTFLSIGGQTYTGTGQIVFNDDADNTVDYTAALGIGDAKDWTLALSLTRSLGDIPNPRCATGSDNCDPDNWYLLSLDSSAASTFTGADGSFYSITDAWGQFGINAGGVHVAENDGYASGFWLKTWTYTDSSGHVSNGGGGDINSYANKVPEPGILALLSMGVIGFGLARRRLK